METDPAPFKFTLERGLDSPQSDDFVDEAFVLLVLLSNVVAKQAKYCDLRLDEVDIANGDLG